MVLNHQASAWARVEAGDRDGCILRYILHAFKPYDVIKPVDAQACVQLLLSGLEGRQVLLETAETLVAVAASQVAHVVLLEQIYRGWTILRGEPYHH